MSNGPQIVTIPRYNPTGAITMGNIIRDAGMTGDEFRAVVMRTAKTRCLFGRWHTLITTPQPPLIVVY